MSGKFIHILRWCGVVGLIVFLLSSWSQADQGFDGMDKETLLREASQLRKEHEQNPSDYEVLQGLGVVYHYLAVKDSKTYASKALQVLEKAYTIKPEDYLILGCLGSVYTLMAKEAINPMTKMDYFNKGIERMDKAVRTDPDNIMIRMIRANNAKAMPRFLNRRSIAYEDLEYLAGLIEKGQTFPLELKLSIYGQLAALNQEDGYSAKAKKYQNLVQTLKQEK